MAYVRRQFNDLAVGDSFRLDPKDDSVEFVRTGNRTAMQLAARASSRMRLTEGVYVFEPDPTPEELLARRIGQFTHALNYRVKTSLAVLDEWRAKLDKNPQYAFEWADTAFEAAAEHHVASRLLAIMSESSETPATTFEMVMQLLREEVKRGARWPSRSTSPSSNHAAQAQLAVYAALLSEYDAK